MPSNWPMVMTPVPPTPATTMLQGRCSIFSVGSGSAPEGKEGAREAAFLSEPPSTVTKLGQKPFRQLVSLLQVL